MRRDIRSLTGLRIVAASWVMMLHFQRLSEVYLDDLPWLRPLVRAGWTGVELFFVLSGFVITLSYVDRIGARPRLGDIGQFVLNRFARVWPAWAAVTVAMGAWLWTARTAGLDTELITPHPMADVPNLLQQLSMTQMWGASVHGGASYVLPGWSISVEWAAYLVFPLLVLALYRLRRLPAWFLLIASVAAIAPLSLIAVTTGSGEQAWPLRISCCFLAGALAGLGVRRSTSTPRTERAALAAVWGSLFLIAAGAMWASWRRDMNGAVDYAGVIVVFFPVLVAGLALTDRGPARWLSTDLMVYGGRISYSLYLVHFAIFDVCMTVLWQGVRRGHVTPLMVLAFPGLVIAAFAAAAVLHHGIEEPCRRLILRAVSTVRGAVFRAPAVSAGQPDRLLYPVPRPTTEDDAIGARPPALPRVPAATARPRAMSDRATTQRVLSGGAVAAREAHYLETVSPRS